MKALLDTTAERLASIAQANSVVLGQLLTPLTRRKWWGGPFAIDNGAFSSCDVACFRRLIERNKPNRHQCLWVAIPDIVGNARRTLEIFDSLSPTLLGWPIALVAQDGLEDLTVPWAEIDCLFIGGSTEWKMSQAVIDLLKTAQILGKQTHIGRVNTPGRFNHFKELADTCDGSGISRFDWMLNELVGDEFMPLFDEGAA